MLPNALTKRVYIFISIIFTAAIIILGWLNFEANKELVIKEKKEDLIKVVNLLEQRLPNSFEQILVQEGAENFDDRAKIRIINKKLQPIIDDIARSYPNYGMGYGIYRQLIAFYPFREDAFEKPTSDQAMVLYDTRKTIFFYNPSANVWGGQATLSVNYPLFYDAKLIGHAWANTKVEVLNHEIMIVLIKNLLIVLLVWALLILLLKKVFSKIEFGLVQFSTQAIEQNWDNTKLNAFPELKALLHNIIHLQQNLILEKDRLVSIVEGTSDGIILLNRGQKCLYSNQRMAIFGFDKMNSESHILEAMPELKDSEWYSSLCKTLASNLPQELKAVKSTGKEMWFNCTFSPCDDGILVVFHDITEEKVNEGLRREMGRLEGLNTIGEIASSFAHELRNPTSVVKGFLELLQKRNGADTGGYHQLMIDELNRMNIIIEDFLSLARLRFNEIKKISVNDIVAELEPLLQADAIKNAIELRIEMPDAKVELELNPREIKQMILNLTRNAIEAMAPKGVLLIVVSHSRQYVELMVKDTGKGISPDILEHIFEPFYTSKPKGTGLGLSVCKDIITSYHGKIEVSSEVGKGTTFKILLPVSADLLADS